MITYFGLLQKCSVRVFRIKQFAQILKRLANLIAVGTTYSIWFSAFNMAMPLGYFAVAP